MHAPLPISSPNSMYSIANKWIKDCFDPPWKQMRVENLNWIILTLFVNQNPRSRQNFWFSETTNRRGQQSRAPCFPDICQKYPTHIGIFATVTTTQPIYKTITKWHFFLRQRQNSKITKSTTTAILGCAWLKISKNEFPINRIHDLDQ